jgi:hypothetical protein
MSLENPFQQESQPVTPENPPFEASEEVRGLKIEIKFDHHIDRYYLFFPQLVDLDRPKTVGDVLLYLDEDQEISKRAFEKAKDIAEGLRGEQKRKLFKLYRDTQKHLQQTLYKERYERM